MRKSISLIILAVYSIVMAHSFIPHHHHSDATHKTHSCEYNHQSEHHGHPISELDNCCFDHDHHSHPFCTFEEKTILTKSIDLSDLFLPSNAIEFKGLEKRNQAVLYCHKPIQTPVPHCRDVQLRGPPYFS